ncbi:MAG: hypothetical protein JRI29_01220 [Deltaproteobacteria bacterium]|nr:hypothetical protein [Deltaproteobacteria bacterium]
MHQSYTGVSSETGSVKTRFCFEKDLHALLWLGADLESFPSSFKNRYAYTGHSIIMGKRKIPWQKYGFGVATLS